MEVIKTAIEGVVIIEPRIFKDARGYFFESFSQREFEEKVGKMKVLKQYPHIVTLEYIGACGKTFETSMTWAEAIILNRRPQKKSKVS